MCWTAFRRVREVWLVKRGSENTLTGSARSESTVKGSNIRPRRSAAAPSTLPLWAWMACSCVMHFTLNTQQGSGLRVWKEHSYTQSLMNVGWNVRPCCSVIRAADRGADYDPYSSLLFGSSSGDHTEYFTAELFNEVIKALHTGWTVI